MNSENAVQYRCPRWAELPRLELYMDQVCIALGDALSGLPVGQEAALTATMINNYVKQRLLAPPCKKKYATAQLSRLIIITLLKRVLSLGEIAAVLADLYEGQGEQEGYDLFCEALEGALNGQPPRTDYPALLAASLRALSGKLEVERLLARA